MVFSFHFKYNTFSLISLNLLYKGEVASKIRNYRLSSDDIKINNYLVSMYKITLKTACYKILQNIKTIISNKEDISFIIKNKKYDKLARLITFGNGKFIGSNIIRNCFAI